MNRTEKAALVETLNKTFSESALVVVTHQVGLTVDEVNQLRGKMRSAGGRYKVTKNRIARLALKGTEYESLMRYSRVRRQLLRPRIRLPLPRSPSSSPTPTRN